MKPVGRPLGKRKANTQRAWSDEEDEILREYAAKHRQIDKGILEALPDRTKNSSAARARRLGLTGPVGGSKPKGKPIPPVENFNLRWDAATGRTDYGNNY